MSDMVRRVLRSGGFKPAATAEFAIALLVSFGAAFVASAQTTQTTDDACKRTLAQTVEFASDRTTLDAKARALVRRQAKCLEAGSGPVSVEGYWDDSSTQPKARELSLRIASRVRDELVKNGVAEARVRAVGHGREQSLDPERPTERRRAVRVAVPGA